jgi:diguanylate cyclase (GGDEF)-like protein
MNIQNFSYIIVSVLGIVSSVIFFWQIWKYRNYAENVAGILLVVDCLIWMILRNFHLLSSSLTVKILMDRIEYIVIAAVPLLYVLVVLKDTGYKKWIKVKNIVLLSIIPFLTAAFIITNDFHGLFWKSILLNRNSDLLVHEYGMWFWIWTVYLCAVVFTTHYMIIRILSSKFSIITIRSIGIIFLISIPWLAYAVSTMGIKPFDVIDIAPLFLIISSAVIVLRFKSLKIVDIVPIAREKVFDTLKEHIIILDNDDRILYINHPAKNIFESNTDNFIGRHITKIISGYKDYFKNISGFNRVCRNIVLKSKSRKKEYEMTVSPIFFNDKNFIGRLLLLRDITTQNKMSKSLKYRIRFENLIATLSKNFINLELDSIDDGIKKALEEIVKFTNTDHGYICVLNNYKIKTGLTYEWLVKGIKPQLKNIMNFFAEELPVWMKKLNKLEVVKIPNVSKIKVKKKKAQKLLKSQKIKSIIAVPMIYNESLIGYMGLDSIKEERSWTKDDIKLLKIAADIFTNILERKEAEEEVRFLLLKDKLTGLYNRAYFEEEIKRLDTKRQLPLSFIMGDVNGLKLVNDAFSPKEGDRILKKAANILKRCCRKEDIIARWGEDEFSILLPNTTEKNSEVIIKRIREKCLKTTDQKIPLSISLGTSTKRDYNCNIKTVIKEAEDRMYSRKLLERDTISSSIISSLESTLQEKSYETEEHAIRLSEMALLIGCALKLPDNKLNELSLLSTLHDIGKIAIPDEILTKKGKLTKKEWEIIKKHPEIGYNITSSSPQLSPISVGILSHHEHWNGNGYPRGLKGEKIPLESRIINIVDAFDVMTHDRCYKKAISREEAIEELYRCSGTQFDPFLVELFTKVLE